jgi:hypothetical protein
MPPSPVRACALAACALALAAAPARAQFRPRQVVTTSPAETYHVEVSAGFWNPTASMQIASGAGSSTVDAKNDLGLKDDRFPEFQLVLKPGFKHKLRVQYIPLKYTQTGTPAAALTFAGVTYPAGAAVNSTIDWKAWRFGYEYDFVSTYRGFIGAIVDVKYTDINASLTAGGQTGKASAQAPIPALGGIMRLYLAENLSITGELSGFKIPGGWIKSTSGHYADADVYAMLNFVDKFGIRAGYRKFDVGYTLTNDTGTLVLDGWYLGAALRF